MKFTTISNPVWANPEHTAIDCVVDFEGLGEVPFTASQGDYEQHGRDIFSLLSLTRSDEIAPYVAPVVVPVVPRSVSKRQLKLALLDLGLLDGIEQMISSSPDRALRINWEDGSVFDRDHSLVSTVASVLGKTPEEIDGLFILAGTK